MLTEKECRNDLSDLKNQLQDILGEESCVDDCIKTLQKLIDEHFDNPPLSLKEVEQCCHEGIPVWDKEIEEYVQIHDVLKGGEEDALVTVVQFFFEDYHVYPYYKTRFYRKEIKDVD